jgi:copper chaperone
MEATNSTLTHSVPEVLTYSVPDVLTYSVPEMSCGHCVNAITSEVKLLTGITDVAIDLETKIVLVTGSELNDAAIREAISEAGFEATP